MPHSRTTEELIAFASVAPLEKLRWLQAVRELVGRLPPATQRIMQKFRSGEL